MLSPSIHIHDTVSIHSGPITERALLIIRYPMIRNGNGESKHLGTEVATYVFV